MRKQRPAMQQLPIEMAREAYALGSCVLEPEPPALARVQDMRIPRGDGSQMLARVYAAQSAEQGVLPVLLYFHGGGFVVGSVDTHDAVCRWLSHASACAVISVE